MHASQHLLPTGEFGAGAASLQVVMHWQYRSINRGADSLLCRCVGEDVLIHNVRFAV